MTIPTERIDALVDAVSLSGSPGGIVGVVEGGELVYSRPFGLANVEYQLPVTVDTTFHIASLSKHFAAFAVAMLADRGMLSFDTPIRKFFPDFPRCADDVTVRHLLHHTSGIRDQWFALLLSGWRLDDVITTRDVMRSIRNQRQLNAPAGQEFNYSNSGYTLLAEIIEIVSGRNLREFCQAEIFEPLEMLSTHFHDDHAEPVAGRAYSYRRDNAQSAWRNAVLNYATVGASSLHTTIGDLARWDANFRTARVGGPGVLELMHTPGVLNDGTELPYCLGLVVDEVGGARRVHHAGGDAGFSSDMARFPEHDVSVIVLSNSGDLGRAPVLSERVQQAILDEFGGEDPNAPPGDDGEDFDSQGFIGRYIHASTGITVAIATSGGDSGGVQGDNNGDVGLWLANSEASRPLKLDHHGVARMNPLLEVRLRRENGELSVEIDSYSDSSMRFRPVDESRRFRLELSDLVGLYFSEELQALCRMDLTEGQLFFSDRSASPSRLNHVEGAAHELCLEHPHARWGGAIIFDEAAVVPAFWFSFPRARRIRYERIAD